MHSRKLTRSLAAVAAAIVIGGGAYGIVSATASNTSATAVATTTATTAGTAGRGGGSNARSGPAAGGAAGTAGTVSAAGFTLTTSAGQTVTVKKRSSVLVLGTVDGSTITATQVIVEAKAALSSTSVMPFQRGAPSSAKQVGQIPANYQEGSGTIVAGTTASKATKAALLAYPGGVVDRVVKLSNGEFEVHNIGVNWPHHVFVSQDFKVLGAD
jgi:hypothetical protein